MTPTNSAAHGTAGALNHLVRMFRSSLGGKCLVLATGGGWRAIKNLVDFKFVEVPAMTLIGTALYSAINLPLRIPNKSI